MKHLLTFLFLLLPSALHAEEKLAITESHLAAVKEYYRILRLEEQHRKLYTESNRKLLETLREHRPCIPASVLDHAGEVGEFPAEEFQKHYVEKIITKLTEDDLRQLIEFYGTHVGGIFIDWRLKNSGKASSPVPINDELEVVIYAKYEDVLKKEHAALVMLSGGELLPEEIRAANDAKVSADVENLVQPYLDAEGNCT